MILFGDEEVTVNGTPPRVTKGFFFAFTRPLPEIVIVFSEKSLIALLMLGAAKSAGDASANVPVSVAT